MIELPRYVIAKKLSGVGKTAYYFNVPTRFRKLACPVPNEPLGTDFAQMSSRAETLNGMLDEWDQARKGTPVTGIEGPKIGSIDWLFREYKQDRAYTEKVDARSRSDYEWAMKQLCDATTKRGDRVGGRQIKSITPLAADRADSTGRRNALFVDVREALVKRLSRCFPTQRLSRSAIERGGDRRERIGAMRAEIGAFGKVLAQQPVGVLIGATLPRALRIAEVDLDPGVNLQTRMLRHLRSLIPGQ